MPLNKLQSIEVVHSKLHNQITIEKGNKMDTATIRTLFSSNAILAVMNRGDSYYQETVSIDEFLGFLTDPYYERGYRELKYKSMLTNLMALRRCFKAIIAKTPRVTKEKVSIAINWSTIKAAGGFIA